MPEFEWDEANEDHILRHGVAPSEAEEAFEDPSRLVKREPDRDGEVRWLLVGATVDGCLVGVIFTRRALAFRVVTARRASQGERRMYTGARRR
jgi:uncharacterized DUF497 family protein